jgi:RNA polymerase sigma-70 factor (ECF subfamily)
LTEQEAILKIAAGNTEAFGTIYDLYIEKIYRFVYYRTHHKQTAEDLTSVVFTKAFDKFSSFDKKANFATWLFRIARNTVIDHYRTKKSVSDIEEAFDLSDSTNISRDYELKEKLDHVKKYLSELAEEQRDLVIMRLWDGLSYAEIAAITGKTEANLRVNFSRVVGRMQKEMVLILILLVTLTQ